MSGAQLSRTAQVVALACVALSAAQCTPRSRPPPRITAVDPSPALNETAQPFTITGEGFGLRLISDLDDPEHAEVRDDYAISIWPLPDGEPLALEQVVRESDTTLHAVLPAGLAPGAWGVRVIDPWGVTIERDDLLEVVGSECSTAADCDDGIGCTTDTCAERRCTHALAPGFCRIDGACVTEGVDPQNACRACTPATSTTDWSPLPETATCEDGLDCTAGDHCDGAGQCVSGATACAAATGDCVEPAGQCTIEGCIYVNKPDGAACDDGAACTVNDACDGAGECVGEASGCGAVMPTACLTVTPALAEPGAPLTFDASCSTDVDAPSQDLVARFDFDGDGTFDTPFGPLIVSAPAGSAGLHFVAVEVRDTSLATDWAQSFYVSTAAADTVVVTTAVDESDPNATPQAPGGTGLSLREALAYVDDASAGQAITFTGPMTVSLATDLELNQEGSVIVGGPGVVLDFTLVTDTSCLSLNEDTDAVVGLTFVGCGAQAVAVKSPGGTIAFCAFRAPADGGGAAVKFDSAGTFGPGNDVRDFTSSSAVEVKTSDVVVTGNHFDNGRVAVDVYSSGKNLRVDRNELVSHSDAAVQVANSVSNLRVWHNTFVGNARGINLSGSSSATVSVRNNLFVAGTGCALGGSASGYAATTPNLFFDNGGTSCAEDPSATGNVAGDPAFIGLENLRLAPQSPAIDVGADVGLDLNGPATGTFFGAAPDFGAHEASY